jgi:microcystin degradation protein MlrC
MIDNSISVADMIAALSALPADARLVMTQSGYYCYDDFADIFSPRPVDANGNTCSDADAVAYSIGHSHQSY